MRVSVASMSLMSCWHASTSASIAAITRAHFGFLFRRHGHHSPADQVIRAVVLSQMLDAADPDRIGVGAIEDIVDDFQGAVAIDLDANVRPVHTTVIVVTAVIYVRVEKEHHVRRCLPDPLDRLVAGETHYPGLR